MLLAAAFNVFAQSYEVAGKVVDSETGYPVQNVTVYINGTSMGTVTNQSGGFRLNAVVLPCEIILSHVSYELKNMVLQDTSVLASLFFSLNTRVITLEGVTVIHEDIRKKYLERFKTWFLGFNYRDQQADILNDSVLIFYPGDNDQFQVTANEPIIILLQETGYILKVDLIKFNLQFKEEYGGYHCSILGYFYFNPIPIKTREKKRSVERWRAETYYNSSMHFCKSLYYNNLTRNGYKFDRICIPEEEGDPGQEIKPVFKAEYISDETGSEKLLLTDFPCNTFRIRYCYNSRNRPVDLTYLEANPSNIALSGIRFLSDSISIYPSGRIPGNSILFSNTMGEKGVASMLPEDYIPSMQ